jgi:hypothetical protein
MELVGGLEHVLFFHILGILIPSDFHIFQRGRSTTNQSILCLDFPMDFSPFLVVELGTSWKIWASACAGTGSEGR